MEDVRPRTNTYAYEASKGFFKASTRISQEWELCPGSTTNVHPLSLYPRTL